MNDKDLIFVSCYVDPDLDGFACAIAYTEYLNKVGRRSLAAVFGTPHIEAQYIMNRFGFKYPEKVENLENSDKIVLVDSSIIDGIHPSIKPEKVIEVIDHRKINDSARFINAKIQIELIGAAATLVAERFFNSKIEMSEQAATLLYGAIISNTLNFQSPLTSERDKCMANRLKEIFLFPENFAQEMFKAKSDLSGDKLSRTLRGDYSQFEVKIGMICIAQLEMVGAKELILKRKDEILNELSYLTGKNKYIFTFLSIIDLVEKCNYFITDNKDAQKVLAEVFEVNFEGDVAKLPGLIMRKQIIPILKDKMA
jgi:manganese-dependent inorganic pyrophosphatase